MIEEVEALVPELELVEYITGDNTPSVWYWEDSKQTKYSPTFLTVDDAMFWLEHVYKG